MAGCGWSYSHLMWHRVGGSVSDVLTHTAGELVLSGQEASATAYLGLFTRLL